MKKITNKNIRVGFDMDGVILNNSGIKVKVARSMGVDIRLSQTPSEIIETHFSPDTYSEFKHIVYNDLRIALSPPLMPGIKGILSGLKKASIPFFLISRRKDSVIPIKILKKYDLWPRYFNEKNTFFVIHPEDKDVKAIELGITHYIDDELKVINVLSSVKNRFLFDQFNVFDKADYYTKVRSWSDFKKYTKLI